MTQLNSHKNYPLGPSLNLLPVLQKTKDAYLLWHSYCLIIPKTHRYSLGKKIDDVFIEIIESLVTASFLTKEEKLPHVHFAVKKIDMLKILLMILWETKSLDNKKYIALSIKIDEIGKMTGGWRGQLLKQNSPNK